MPVIDLVCGCGHRYEGLQSFSTADPDLGRCPVCGGAPTRVYGSGGRHKRVTTVDDVPRDEMAEHLEAKAYYESISDKILSGEVVLKERGPKELRPVCPRRYF